MRATGIFTVFSVPLLLVVPLVVALVMNQKFRGRNLFRAIYFAPYVLGVAVVAVMWRFLLDRNIGVVNYYLGVLGLPDDIAWLTLGPGGLGRPGRRHRLVDARASTRSSTWPACRTSRASSTRRPRSTVPAGWQQFRHVTLPGLRPVIVVRHDDHDHRLGQHVRPVVPDDQRCARAPRRGRRSTRSPRPACSNFQMGEAAAHELRSSRCALMLLSVGGRLGSSAARGATEAT